MAAKDCFDMTKLISKIMCVTVLQWSRSCLHVQINRVRLSTGEAVFCFFVPFFFSSEHYFSFWPFFVVLTADLAGHALGSIYILSFSLEFYFGKGISKALDLRILAKLTTRKNPVSCQDMSLPRNS